MRLPTLLVCVVLLAVVGFAPAPFPRAERRKVSDDMEAMLGWWKVTLYQSNGLSMGTHYKVRIRRDAWTFFNTQDGGQTESTTWILTLRPQLSPRGFEWKHAGSPHGWIGSYRLEGRRLEVIFSSGLLAQIDNRPKDFGGQSGYRMVLEYIGRE